MKSFPFFRSSYIGIVITIIQRADGILFKKAHHHRKPNRVSCGNFKFIVSSMYSIILASGFFVRRLYGDVDMSQQYSRIVSSSSSFRPASSRICMRFDLPRMLSYSVPLGMLYWMDAWVNRNSWVTTEWIASRS